MAEKKEWVVSTSEVRPLAEIEKDLTKCWSVDRAGKTVHGDWRRLCRTDEGAIDKLRAIPAWWTSHLKGRPPIPGSGSGVASGQTGAAGGRLALLLFQTARVASALLVRRSTRKTEPACKRTMGTLGAAAALGQWAVAFAKRRLPTWSAGISSPRDRSGQDRLPRRRGLRSTSVHVVAPHCTDADCGVLATARRNGHAPDHGERHGAGKPCIRGGNGPPQPPGGRLVPDCGRQSESIHADKQTARTVP